MKEIRVHTNSQKERIVPATYVKYLGTVLLFLFLLPYIITTLFHNMENSGSEQMKIVDAIKMMGEEGEFSRLIFVQNTTAAGSERIPLEIYLIDKLSRTIDPAYEPETLKAQAIVLRTGLIEQLWSDSGSIDGDILIQDEEYGRGEMNETFVWAVYNTRGAFLTWRDKPAKAPYFAVSNGKTRESSEVLGDEGYPYLVAVSCERDFLSADYTQIKMMSKSEWTAAWEKKTGIMVSEDLRLDQLSFIRDSNDYVIQVTYYGTGEDEELREVTLSGEECRILWGLDSACFQISEESGRIQFTVTGIGHGLGMSQFAANEMVKQEYDYIEILAYFFPGTQLTKIE